MNLTMPPPISYPFYMDSPRLPFPMPWATNPYHFPVPVQQHLPRAYQSSMPLPPGSYPLPFVLRQQQPPLRAAPPPGKLLHPASPYSNTRYNHLKQSTSYVNRNRSMETSFHNQQMPTSYHHYPHSYRPSKTKSVSDFQQLSNAHSNHLPKAHSWHSLNPHNQFHRPNGTHPSSASSREQHFYRPKQNAPQRFPPPPPAAHPQHTCLRPSPYDEMPIIHNPIYQRSHSTSSRQSINQNLTGPQMNPPISPSISCSDSSRSSSSSSSSSAASHVSFQERFNGSLRTDPLLAAAMEDFQELRRTSSRSTSLTYVFPLRQFSMKRLIFFLCSAHRRDLSRDSLCSESTPHSMSRSRSHSQSSFTSLERLEIRHLIKALKTKGLRSLELPLSSPLSRSVPVPFTEQSISKPAANMSAGKHQKSSITEELDQKFAQLRSIDPNRDLIYVKPSLLHKQHNNTFPPLSTVRELLQKAQLQSAEDEKKPTDDSTTSPNPMKLKEEDAELTANKPEYAIPQKNPSVVHLRSHKKKDEQMRSFSFCKPMNDLVHETRPASMLNWFQSGLTNQLPATFQPNRMSNIDQNTDGRSLVKENIYASEIDVHVPFPDEKHYFHDPHLMAEYFSACKSSSKHASIFQEFSRLFSRSAHHHQHQAADEKCPRKSKYQKTNYRRCSIM